MTDTLLTQFSAFLASALLIPAIVFLAHAVNHRSMRFWWVGAAACSTLFFGSAFAALRGILPETVMISVGNSLIIAGYFLCLRSLRLIKDEFRLEYLDITLMAVGLIAFYSVLGMANEYANRVAAISAYIALVSALVVWMATSTKGRKSIIGDAFIGLFGVGNLLTSLIRGSAALTDHAHPAFSLAFWEPVFFIWSIGAVFCFAIGFFINGAAALSKETQVALQHQQNLSNALEAALEDQRNLQKLMLHEVKRPLNAISTTVQAMQGQPNVGQDDLKRIRQLTQQANAYLEGLSEFDEISSLLDYPNLSAICVEDLAKDLEQKWSVHVSGLEKVESETLCVDRFLFDIALGNLIENAQKFGKFHSVVKVQVSVDLNKVIFDVVDDGLGITPNEAEKVFGKFYKIGPASGNSLRGCGLGLYVVRRIAEAHKGESYVVSQAPSIIRFILPLNKSYAKNV
jgi:signal transduction histidine kinase